jgi:hypothetical protein
MSLWFLLVGIIKAVPSVLGGEERLIIACRRFCSKKDIYTESSQMRMSSSEKENNGNSIQKKDREQKTCFCITNGG